MTLRAENGDDAAQLGLGKAYFNAYYIENNCFNAFKWIELSADQGNMEAQFRLADLYALGLGCLQSHTNAYRWYTKAAIQGYKKALIRIHNLYKADEMVHCRGILNDDENELDDEEFKETHNIRELNEYRLEQSKRILNHAMDYYSNLFTLQKSAGKINATNQQTMAFLYQHGYGTKKYTRWAIELYTKAAEQGLVDAQYNLGCLYQQNTGIKFNYQKAYKWYLASAEGGNIAAQNQLAYFYQKGLGTDMNYEAAFYWYTKAGDAGHSNAQLTLGKLYRKGEHVNQDDGEAIKWYMLAAQQGNIVAQNCLYQLYQHGRGFDHAVGADFPEYLWVSSKMNSLNAKLHMDVSKLGESQDIHAIQKLSQCALVGDGNAMYQIGLKYYHGHHFPQNKDTGLGWIKNAANSGIEVAKLMLIKMYETGDTVEQNYYKASAWCKSGINLRQDKAQYNLGMLYEHGLGVRKDSLEASRWFTLSAQQKNGDAQYQLGTLRYDGRGLRQNFDEAIEWFTLSAKNGNTQSCFKLGTIHLEDKHVKQDIPKALQFYVHASRRGETNAQYELAKLYENGNYFEKNIEKSRQYYTMCEQDNPIFQYEMALRYLEGGVVKQDFLKAFNLLKQAADQKYYLAENLFKTPIIYDNNCDCTKLVKAFIIASKINNAAVEFNIGNMYECGILDRYKTSVHLDKDYANATRWYSIAANKGDSRAQFRLGIMHEIGNGVAKNLETALMYYTMAYENRNSSATCRLAYMYLNGSGVPPDTTRAFQFYLEASNMGNNDARETLMLPHIENKYDFLEYDLAEEIPHHVDDKKKLKMLEHVAALGNVAIQYQLGTIYEQKNPSKAFIWFKLASKGGATDAQYKLGTMYENGNGVKKDLSNAVKLYKIATKRSHKDALFRLAQLCQNGLGTDLNYKTAYKLYLMAAREGHVSACRMMNNIRDYHSDANMEIEHTSIYTNYEEFMGSILMCSYMAEQGDIDLQYKLGTIYESVFSVPDYIRAFKWYLLAANNSHREAMYRLGLLYEKGLGVGRNYEKAVQLYTQAHYRGSRDSLFRLGKAYHRGNGVELDSSKAIQCYLDAANDGHAESQYVMGQLFERGELVLQDTLESLKWYTKAYLQGYDQVALDLYRMFDHPPYENYFYNRLYNIFSTTTTSLLFADMDDYKSSYGYMFYRLGELYVSGKGTVQDHAQGLQCFSTAKNEYASDEAIIFFYLRYDGRPDLFKHILEMCEMLVDHLDSKTQYNLAKAYYYGIKGSMERRNSGKSIQSRRGSIIKEDSQDAKLMTIVPQNFAKAFAYMELSATRNQSEAQYTLGEMYWNGHGVSKNIESGIKWYIHSQINGSTYSNQDFLVDSNMDFHTFIVDLATIQEDEGYDEGCTLNGIGMLYEYGIGIEQDYEKAIGYYERSHRLGDRGGCYNLGAMYYYGKGGKQDYKRAFWLFSNTSKKEPSGSIKHVIVLKESSRRFWKSEFTYKYTEKGDTKLLGDICYYLGVMYRNGQGTASDEYKAYQYFLKGATYGCELARNESRGNHSSIATILTDAFSFLSQLN
jgi:TPR repeat protein